MNDELKKNRELFGTQIKSFTPIDQNEFLIDAGMLDNDQDLFDMQLPEGEKLVP